MLGDWLKYDGKPEKLKKEQYLKHLIIQNNFIRVNSYHRIGLDIIPLDLVPAPQI